MGQEIINFAHRGASAYCPENTMAAFVKSIELGATGIETDVQVTKDGHLVLIHDETFDRTAGASGWVKDYLLEEIRNLDAGSGFHSDFRGERVPTLEELLQFVKECNIVVNLELKNSIVLYPGIEEKVIAAVRSFDLTAQTIISSFNHYSLALCKQLAPEIKTGILYMEGLYEPWNYARTIGADALHAEHHAVLPEFTADASKHGLVYHPFTVNDPEEMKRLIKAGVAGIITDYPDRLHEVLEAEGSSRK
ncbi:glycerophosphodiester phosphodiesterase [Paenibacillus sediminis]|uniref:Glycerophosphoryl diester phosphodiesterase n=1 Tax=Paenibacillus sediminis TaxID=664909 RepID=A0ABS4H359_9BACL|nr:glycerophosphodiester phosphodiesterase [Paenibacillus sediminis]MBP1936974.1 glycerophosphoryl diester phosphodiesterase [Paenibacillus sediminis]